MKKRFLSALLAAAVTVTAVPWQTAFAEGLAGEEAEIILEEERDLERGLLDGKPEPSAGSSGAEVGGFLIESVEEVEPLWAIEEVAESESAAESETERESEAETETESESETEAETESETESETEAGTESETEAETETESESETEVGNETEAGNESEAGTESETESKTETETETDTWLELASESENKAETGTEAERELGNEPEMLPATRLASEPGSAAETEDGSAAASGGELVAEPDRETVPESESGMETEPCSETAAEPGSAAETEPGRETASGSGSETETEPNRETAAEPGSVPEFGSEAASGSSSEAGIEPLPGTAAFGGPETEPEITFLDPESGDFLQEESERMADGRTTEEETEMPCLVEESGEGLLEEESYGSAYTLSVEEGSLTGSFGAKITYSVNLATGELVFSGTGAMTDSEAGYSGRGFYPYYDTITSVTIGEGITSVGNYAFFGMMSLERVSLPQSLTSIGEGAFIGCTALDRVFVPAGVASIGKYAFGYYCNNGKYGTYEKKEMSLVGYSGSAAETYAKEHTLITFFPVTNASGAFGEGMSWTMDYQSGALAISGNGPMPDFSSYGDNVAPYYGLGKLITSVTVGEGVTSIGDNAFYCMVSLEAVSLPQSLTEIGRNAFYGCRSLQAVSLPAGLASIEYGAFRGCESLLSVDLPDQVSSVGSYVFEDCENLQAIQVGAGNGTYSSLDGILYDKDRTALLLVPEGLSCETLRIPETVTSISGGAFYQQRTLCTVWIPASVTRIGYQAFSECAVLDAIIFQGSAPAMFSWTIDKEGIRLYCSFSDASWQSQMAAMTCPKEINWVNTDSYSGLTSLSIGADGDTLETGQSMQLTAMLDPQLCVDFVWDSTDLSVALVDGNGMLTACAPGTVTVSAQSADGVYLAYRTFTVIGQTAAPQAVEVTQIEEGDFTYTSTSTETLQIPCAQKKGIYFLQGEKLSFYSLKTKKTALVHTFQGCTSAYSADNKLYVAYGRKCWVYDLLTGKAAQPVTLSGYQATAVGADSLGRIYLAASNEKSSENYRIFLYSAEGALLSSMAAGTQVYRFSGFDSTTGNFYMESWYDYYSWGYSHPGKALTMGKVTGNTISSAEKYNSFLESGILTREMSNIMYLCQNWYLDHQNNAALLGGRYLVAVSVLTGEVRIMDSWSDTLETCLSFSREPTEVELVSTYSDPTSIGVRAVYHPGHESILLYENNRLVTEYDIKTGKRVAQYQTAGNVFNMFWMDGLTLALVEKDGEQFRVETVDWSDPASISIKGASSMKVGESQQLSVAGGTPYTIYYEWSSSNDRVASVSANGELAAWKTGKVKVKASNLAGTLTATRTVTVKAPAVKVESVKVVSSAKGAASENLSRNDYTVWSSTNSSYLEERSDGKLERIEYIPGKGVVSETYTAAGKLTGSKVIKAELPIFGGFFAGSKYYFLVFGQENKKQSDKKEVVRVVKYSKSWKRLGALSIYGANTYIPFDAGSLRMDETGSTLYIHTCHEMYAGEGESVHHQANMTFVVDEETMTQKDAYYDVLNVSQAGYVSHSFSQFVRTDGTYVYRVDHGDGGPRAVTLTRAKVDGKITDVDVLYLLSIAGGYGANATGVSVGGFELSTDNCLVAGNSVDQDKDQYDASGQRNIFLAVADRDMRGKKVLWLTDYKKNAGVEVRTPQLVKLSNSQFLLLWEEYNSKKKVTATKMVTVNGDGKTTSPVVTTYYSLSGCQPIVTGTGVVKWYVTNQEGVYFFSVNPYNLEALEGAASCVRGHSWGKWKTTKQATVKAKGTQKRTCTVCKKTETRSVAKLKPTIKLNASAIRLKKKQSTTKLKVTMAKGDAVKKWVSSNTKVVKVTKSGKVTAQNRTGRATLTVTLASGKKAKVRVTVQKDTVKTTKLTVPKKSLQLKVGKKYTVKPVVTPLTSGQKVTYTSSNKKVAAVSSKGVITAKKAGKAKITVKSGTKKAVITVTAKK